MSIITVTITVSVPVPVSAMISVPLPLPLTFAFTVSQFSLLLLFPFSFSLPPSIPLRPPLLLLLFEPLLLLLSPRPLCSLLLVGNRPLPISGLLPHIFSGLSLPSGIFGILLFCLPALEFFRLRRFFSNIFPSQSPNARLYLLNMRIDQAINLLLGNLVNARSIHSPLN
jgi:hypothetical protein